MIPGMRSIQTFRNGRETISSVGPWCSRMPDAQVAVHQEAVAALSASGIAKRLAARQVLQGIDLKVAAGELVVVTGRSGSGKSTLIHVLAGLDAPDVGTVLVRGQDIAAMDATGRAEHRLRHIGVVFQHFNLLADLTVAENVALPMKLAHVEKRAREQRVSQLLDIFGIAPLAPRFPEGLSGGEMQRVAVARALANKPSVVLADEPTANLDDGNARDVVKALLTAAKEGAGVVVASHDPVVSDAAPRRLALMEGRLHPPS